MPTAVCLALANGMWLDMMETMIEWKFLEPLHDSPLAVFPLCHFSCMSLSKGCFSLDFSRKRPSGPPIANLQLRCSMSEGKKESLLLKASETWGLVVTETAWRKLTGRGYEPIWANEREQIPGPVGLLLNESLLYPLLGDVLLESWAKGEPWTQIYLKQILLPPDDGHKNHFIFNPG